MNKIIKAGFIGAGGIARSHALALSSLRYYYNDAPEVKLCAVSSFTGLKRESFGTRFGFERAIAPEEFFKDEEIDTVYILGPNKVHFEHTLMAAGMRSVKRIYIEKPLCSTAPEEDRIREIAGSNPGISFQVGFQFLFMTPVREALRLWKSGIFGDPLHFEVRYYHGDYLQKPYRDKRANRLTPAPDGGAMADLGSHAISLLTAFLGEELDISDALKAGQFEDVDRRSDLFSVITITDRVTGAAGTISASRIASGTGDLLSMDLYAKNGSIHFTTQDPEHYEYYLEEKGIRMRVHTGSTYNGITSFPSGHVPPGWLRPMIHAHYVFLGGKDPDALIPGIDHGLAVQRIVRETAELITRKYHVLIDN